MRNDTIYLLYNASTADVRVRGRREREDKEFVILYGPEDRRRYTDIRVVSRTELRQRPRSAGPQRVQGLGGVLLRRTGSLGPDIRPLLSEGEIAGLQRAQEECRKHRRATTAPTLDRELEEEEDLRAVHFERILGENTGQITPGQFDQEKIHVPQQREQLKQPAFDTLQKEKPAKILGVQENEGFKSRLKKGITEASRVKAKTNYENTPKKKKLVSDKENIHSGSKLKSGKPQLQSHSKNYAAGKAKRQPTSPKVMVENAKKGKENPVTGETLVRSAKSNKDKSNRSSKSELSAKSKKSGKNVKSLKSKNELQENKSKDDTSLKIKRDIKPEKAGNDENDFKSVKNAKRKLSVSPSSKTKGSGNTEKSVSSKQKKGVTGDEADGQKSSEKLKVMKGEKGGITSDLESVKSPKSKKLLNRDGEEKSLSSGKSPDVNITKAKRGRTKSILTTTGPTPARTSERSENKADPSQKKDKPGRQKKSRTYSAEMDYMIRYVLSDPVFIKLGWTLSADDRILNRVVTFKTSPANPDLYCFRHRDEAVVKTYASGNVAVNIDTDGSGKILYPSGHPAVVIEAATGGMRLTVYTDKKKEPTMNHSKTRLVGIFDSFGNGAVYDKSGKRILNYNQLEGIYHNPVSKTLYKWRWRAYEMLAKQRVKELMNHMAKEHRQPEPAKGKRPVSSARSSTDKQYEQILAELPSPAPAKSKVRRYSSASGFKSVIMKITDEITLRINGQENITIMFSADKISHRLDLGVKVDPEAVERVEDVSLERIEDIPCAFEDLLNLSPSLEKLNRELHPELRPSIKKRPT